MQLLSRLRSSRKSKYQLVSTDEPSVLSWFERFFRQNYQWLLYLKTLPSMLLLGTFGRRPITIAKLATPKVVESFAAFLGPLLGPILFLALIDSLYIAASVFQENWRIKQYEKARNQRETATEEPPESPENQVAQLRQSINKLPKDQDAIQFVKKNILDSYFRKQLTSQSINEDLFIEQLLATNRFKNQPREFAEANMQLTIQNNCNYEALWLGAQVDYLRAKIDEHKKHLPLLSESEKRRVFILNNILTPRTRRQFEKMDIDENKFVELLLLNNQKSALDIVKYFNPGKKSFFTSASSLIFGKTNKDNKFDYGLEWLVMEIKFIQCHSFQPLPSDRLKMILEKSQVDETQVMNAAYEKCMESRFEYSHQNIVNRFKCLTTEKDFSKEYPLIDKFIYYYEYNKKLFVFPLRTISLCLALEVMMPFSFPILISIAIYATIGFALSCMIVNLESFTDGYLKELRASREKELEALHDSEQAGTFARLTKNCDFKRMKTRLDIFEQNQETNGSKIVSISPTRSIISGTQSSPEISPVAVLIQSNSISTRPRANS